VRHEHRAIATVALLIGLSISGSVASFASAGRDASVLQGLKPGKEGEARLQVTGDIERSLVLDGTAMLTQLGRDFHTYFGTLPGADGIPMRDGEPAVCIPNPYQGECQRPYHTTSPFQDGGPHGKVASDVSRNGGRMDGFIRAMPATQRSCAANPGLARCERKAGPEGQPDVMGWHDATTIPNYWAYAENFVLQDRMFGPVDSWTLPAHLFLVSAWSAYCPDPSDPMSCRSDLFLDEPGQLHRYGDAPIYAWTDITYLLHREGVSWAYYVAPATCVKRPCNLPDDEAIFGGDGRTPSGKNPLPGFVTVHENRQIRNIRPWTDYYAAAEAGTLPSVSWVVPGNRNSEHPGSGTSINQGQAHVTRLVNAAMRGPDRLRSTRAPGSDQVGPSPP